MSSWTSKKIRTCGRTVNNASLLSLDDSFINNLDFNEIEAESNYLRNSSNENNFLQGARNYTEIDSNLKIDQVKSDPQSTDNIRLSLILNSTNDVAIKSVNSPKQNNCRHNSDTSFYGLPHGVKDLFNLHKNIKDLYEWQQEVLSLQCLIERKNLLLILPTSGGKTLIAEILILKELLCNKKDVLFILPYVSLVHEKVTSLSPFALEMGFLIEEYAGSKGKFPPTKRKLKNTVFVSTIEKADVFVNSLLEEKRLGEIGLVVVDEFHLIGEALRGAIVELILIKIMHSNSSAQIIAMSATVGNPKEMADFLEGFVYTNNFRPVNLFEFIKIDDDIFKVTNAHMSPVPLEFVKKFKNKGSYKHLDIDPDFIGYLVREVIPNKSCLVFCPTKKNCENIAELICKTLPNKILEFKKEEKKLLLNNLSTEGYGNICIILKRTIRYGVVYHHSGLTAGERKILEEAFLNNTICCICCTSTLAAGVNLPAARVILRSPYVGSSFISPSQYKQMVGRAGRAGMEAKGESFLVCRGSDAVNVHDLVSSSVGPCKSQLTGDGLTRLVLSALSLDLARDRNQLVHLLRRSLLSRQLESDSIHLQLDTLLFELASTQTVLQDGDSIQLTDIGKAAVKGNFPIQVAKLLYSDLTKAKSKLVLSSHLHLLYLITPYDVEVKPSHEVLINILLSLDTELLKVAYAVGISDATITRIATGRGIPKGLENVFKRFYASLILNDLLEGKDIWRVSKRFGLDRGFIFSFLSMASSFAAAVCRFCEVFPEEAWCYLKLLADYPQKIIFCSSQELIPLMELPAVRLGRARQLYNAGFKTVSLVAQTDPKELARAIDLLPLRQARLIVSSAKMILLSKAELLQEEAQDIMQVISI